MIEEKINLMPCPLCGKLPDITTLIHYSDGNRMVIECGRCGLTLDHTQHYPLDKSAIDLWNSRVPELGNEEQTLLDKMFPKCTNCKSRPSDYSSVVCMCNEGIYIPQHPPRKQDTRFRLGKYEEMEINK